MSGPYDDIIDLAHPTSAKHPRMPRENRAAQFTPFAALTGYEAALHETARLTDAKKLLDENTLATLDLKLSLLAAALEAYPEVAVTYFQPDAKKKGGAYVTAVGALKRIDALERTLVFTDGTSVAAEDILEIESDIFRSLNDW